MQVNKLNYLQDKARNTRNCKFFLSEKEIVWVEKKLSVKFPSDFRALNGVYQYDGFVAFEFYSFDSHNDDGVSDTTIELQKIYDLPKNYLVAAHDDVSMLLFEMQADNMRVIWCGHEEFERLCSGKPMEDDYTIFETFADFYEYLLDEEEKERLGLEE